MGARISISLLVLGLAACATVGHDENLDRIDEAMRPEPFNDATPGAAGIALGFDAPPLAPGDAAATWSRSGDGYTGGYAWTTGFNRGGRTWSSPSVADPAQPFGGGTLGRGPMPASGNFPGGRVGR